MTPAETAPSPPVQAVPPVRTTLPERTVSGALYDPQTEQRAYRSLQDSYYQALARADCMQRRGLESPPGIFC